MTKTYDTIVLGIGGMGSATLMHLAARGETSVRSNSKIDFRKRLFRKNGL